MSFQFFSTDPITNFAQQEQLYNTNNLAENLLVDPSQVCRPRGREAIVEGSEGVANGMMDPPPPYNEVMGQNTSQLGMVTLHAVQRPADQSSTNTVTPQNPVVSMGPTQTHETNQLALINNYQDQGVASQSTQEQAQGCNTIQIRPGIQQNSQLHHGNQILTIAPSSGGTSQYVILSGTGHLRNSIQQQPLARTNRMNQTAVAAGGCFTRTFTGRRTISPLPNPALQDTVPANDLNQGVVRSSESFTCTHPFFSSNFATTIFKLLLSNVRHSYPRKTFVGLLQCSFILNDLKKLPQVKNHMLKMIVKSFYHGVIAFAFNWFAKDELALNNFKVSEPHFFNTILQQIFVVMKRNELPRDGTLVKLFLLTKLKDTYSQSFCACTRREMEIQVNQIFKDLCLGDVQKHSIITADVYALFKDIDRLSVDSVTEVLFGELAPLASKIIDLAFESRKTKNVEKLINELNA